MNVHEIKNIKDIEWYIITNLKYNENGPVVIHNGIKYKSMMGFRRSYYISELYKQIDGNKVGFHIWSDTDDVADFKEFTLGLYNSVSECITGVSKIYAEKWNIK